VHIWQHQPREGGSISISSSAHWPAPGKSDCCIGVQVVIVPIVKKDDEREAVLAAARALHGAAEAAGLRARLDADEARTPGWKFHFWEMKVGACRGACRQRVTECPTGIPAMDDGSRMRQSELQACMLPV
jgi:Anticodon binding domain